MSSKQIYANHVRNFVFGVEDSLVSTVGLLSGIAYASVDKKTILLTGIILIFVEAFSMGVGSFLSETSTEEYLNHKTSGKTIKDAIIMFTSYLLSGFIPLSPYLIFNTKTAFWYSIVVSLGALFILGVVSAKLLKTKILKSASRMLLIGGIAIVAGVIVGRFVKYY